MPLFEYKVVPAPRKGLKAKGLKRAEDRFALALSTVMNELGAEGWDYVRADILPAEERSGLASKQTVYHNMLVFRRALPEAEDATPATPEQEQPKALAAPDMPGEEQAPVAPDPEAAADEAPRQDHAAH